MRYLLTPFLLIAMLIGLASVWLSLSGEEQAPSLSLRDIRGGEHSLRRYRGKVVVVNFWASWCPPCVAELPSLELAWQRHRQQGLVVIGVTDESNEAVTNFLKRLPIDITFPILFNNQHIQRQEWKVRAFPTTVVVDRNGDLHWRSEGQLNFFSTEINDILVSALLKPVTSG